MEMSEMDFWNVLQSRHLDDAVRQLESDVGRRRARQMVRKWLYDGVIFQMFGPVDVEERLNRLEAILNHYPKGVSTFGPFILPSYLRPPTGYLRGTQTSYPPRMAPTLRLQNYTYTVHIFQGLDFIAYGDDEIVEEEAYPFIELDVLLDRCFRKRSYRNIAKGVVEW
ncbi:hypothetical protein HDV00_007403 [Rhizophlyctis rosea]|nr:hypothetical protein HDV00_007403 [Rhizophlyctis rosea]